MIIPQFGSICRQKHGLLDLTMGKKRLSIQEIHITSNIGMYLPFAVQFSHFLFNAPDTLFTPCILVTTVFTFQSPFY